MVKRIEQGHDHYVITLETDLFFIEQSKGGFRGSNNHRQIGVSVIANNAILFSVEGPLQAYVCFTSTSFCNVEEYASS